MAVPTAITPAITTTYSTAKLLGFIAADGIKFDENRPTTKIYAWGSDIVANPQESFDETMNFTLYEFLNADAAKAAYGSTNVTATAADSTHGARLSIKVTSDALDTSAWIIDTFSPGGKRIQFLVPIGQIVNKGTMTMNNKTVLAHDLTAECSRTRQVTTSTSSPMTGSCRRDRCGRTQGQEAEEQVPIGVRRKPPAGR
jgi:hypothetical protein